MSLESELVLKALEWRRLAEKAADEPTRRALTKLADEYETTAALKGGNVLAGGHHAGSENLDMAGETPLQSDLSHQCGDTQVATLRDRLVEDLRAIALPIVTKDTTGQATLMALAEVAGDVIAAVATSSEHLEEGLLIFARMTRSTALSRPVGRQERT